MWSLMQSCFVLQESGGSARTDYRAIQLAKKKKQRGPPASSGETHLMLQDETERRPKGLNYSE